MTDFRYRVHRFWSPLLGCEAARVSVADEHGGEFWAIVPAGGKGWRERRDIAVERLSAAIEAGRAPGEVQAG